MSLNNQDDVTRVLFIWNVPDRLRDYLQEGLRDVENLELLFPDEGLEDQYPEMAQSADIVVGWRPTDGLIENAPSIRLFINPGVGVQHHIDRFRELGKTREITLVNGHGNTYFTAQHAIALLLALMNKVIPHHNWMIEGEWRKGDADAISIPLRFRRVGFLGYGAVNSKVHRFLSGFDIEFSILKRDWKREIDTPTDYKKFETDKLLDFLEHIDILFIAVPQTSETIGLIGEQELTALGKEGILVNIARGLVVDEKSLYNALLQGTIAGAAIDVWYEYRPELDENGRKYPYEFPFHTLENIVLSPHRGASPMNDLLRWNEVIENITRFADGRDDFLNIVELDRGY